MADLFGPSGKNIQFGFRICFWTTKYHTKLIQKHKASLATESSQKKNKQTTMIWFYIVTCQHHLCVGCLEVAVWFSIPRTTEPLEEIRFFESTGMIEFPSQP